MIHATLPGRRVQMFPFSCHSPPILNLISFLLLLSTQCNGTAAYFANWGDIGRAQEPTCVDIPQNMSLCSNIEYQRMRLPNLLAHDTLTEVGHQSASWVPLLNVRCHPDTQLFLCSLFTPVCLERPIYPCRSLCDTVQKACEHRMTTYGYNWPDMLSCHNFPEDNDMCLKGVHGSGGAEQLQQTAAASAAGGAHGGGGCGVCDPVPTYENILDHFCRADFVLRVRIKAVRERRVITRKARVYKPALSSSPNSDPSTVRSQRRALRKPQLLLGEDAVSCCAEKLSTAAAATRYLVMGTNTSQGFVPTFVLPWSRQKSIRDAVRVFDGLDCSDPSLFTPDTQSGAILNTASAAAAAGGRRRGRNRAGRRRNGKRKNGGAAAASAGAGRAEGKKGRRGRNREAGGNRASSRRRGGGGNRRNGTGSKRGSEGENNNSERKRARKNRRKDGDRKDNNKRSRNRQQRLGSEEKQRRKDFIRRKIEQSNLETNSVRGPLV